jgi:DNA-binding XRE family transcriptional regulator
VEVKVLIQVATNPLLEYRSKHFYTQNYRARLLKVKKQQINAWEKDKYLPNMENFEKIAKFTNITWDEWEEYLAATKSDKIQ